MSSGPSGGRVFSGAGSPALRKNSSIPPLPGVTRMRQRADSRSEEHTSELQSRQYLVCRLLLEKKTRYPVPSAHSQPTLRPSCLGDAGMRHVSYTAENV